MAQKDPGASPDDPREFAAVIVDLPDANTELGAGLQELIKAVRATGKPGTLSLKLGVKLLAGTESTLQFIPQVTVSAPKRDLRSGVFYADRHNNPRRNDPNQPGLFDETEVRDVPNADARTGEVKEL